MSLSQTITYDVAGNFTFDSSLVSIAAGSASLKDNSPANATFYASWDSTVDGTYGSGALTATNSGGAITTGSLGKFNEGLDLRGGTVKYVRYSATANADSAQGGAFSFWYKPAYGGVTSAVRQLFAQCKDLVSGLPNLNECYHDLSNMHLTWRMFGSNGVQIFSADLGAWTPVANTPYEFEFNWDLTTGASRLFINGTQFGSTQAATGTRSSASIGYLFIGTDRSATTATDAIFDDFTAYNAVQHTANFTAPTVGNYKYTETNPTIQVNSGVLMDGVDGFTETASYSGTDAVKYYLLVDGVAKYWNGSAWATSNSTYAQANTAAEIQTNKAALVLTGNTVKVVALLHSGSGASTPTLTSIKLDYNFFVAEPNQPNKCICYMWMQDILGVIPTTATLYVKPVMGGFNSQHFIVSKKVSGNANASGYIEMTLDETTSGGLYVQFTLAYSDGVDTRYRDYQPIKIPNQATLDLSTVLLV